jgi:archaemetzincin
MPVKNITLIAFGYLNDDLLDSVYLDVEREFSVPVKTKQGHLDLSEFFDSGRKQYNGNLLLKEIEQKFAKEKNKTLGIFNVDLYIPILTYIFGQAYLNGNCGIASIYRLNNDRYGLKPDKQIFYSRIRKEIIHELGHTFGLLHCSNPICVMRSSTYVEDIDQKEQQFCTKCRQQVLNYRTTPV